MLRSELVDKSVVLKEKNGRSYLEKGSYSVARMLTTGELAYVAYSYEDMLIALNCKQSVVGKIVSLAKLNADTNGLVIVSREHLSETRIE